MPLNWPALIKETLKRRKEEGLTQKAHAALANVSIPTMIDFEKGSSTISLKKAMDILDVVGLLAKDAPLDSLDTFSEKAEQRWGGLVEEASKEKWFKELGNRGNNIIGHSDGYFTYTYQIKGTDLISMDSDQFLRKLKEAAKVKYSGWTPFNIFTRTELEPYFIEEGLIECWLKESLFMSPSRTDFWLASSKGFLHLHRGYHEDGLEDFASGKRFDLESPILRAVEIILHSQRIAQLIAKEFTTAEINMKAHYRGLSGRILTSQSPASLYETHVCQRDSIDMQTSFYPSSLSVDNSKGPEALGQIVYDLLKELYASFGFYELRKEFVDHKINYLIQEKW